MKFLKELQHKNSETKKHKNSEEGRICIQTEEHTHTLARISNKISVSTVFILTTPFIIYIQSDKPIETLNSIVLNERKLENTINT